ncbi:VWA domain-containing protein [Nocardia sp. NEAU-351]|uniref:VWA domain-containing protein n=2 Tax=Nocardia bovistercoris TaxID=2785916 RepID=A0A931N5F5_9NOCA|nr:VWA domain-containing protein [Nocardia bovistercoris]MBH0779346.1 VWA domain-containing protein [Nocardia bovistercoris]
MIKGQNFVLPAGEVTLSIRVAAPADLVALSVTDRGTVRGDHDLVFYNNPLGEGVRLVAGPSGAPAAVVVDPAAIPADIAEVRAVITLDDPAATFASLAPPIATVTDAAGNTLCDYRIDGLVNEAVVIALEMYRRNGVWKIRAVGQGYAGGFADLITDHGIDVEDAPAVEPPVPTVSTTRTVPDYSRTVSNPMLRYVAAENMLSIDQRRELDHRKKVVLNVLTTGGVPGARARIVLVIDKTGSMAPLYRIGAVHRVVHRMIPIAIQLDDDGRLEPYLYAKQFAALPAVTVDTAEQWCRTYLHLSGVHGGIDYAHIGGANNEIPIMREIIDTHDPTIDPTLVLFFTDGGFNQKRQITALLREASALPIFWQFIGLGAANYGLLRELDTMDGRVVDNAGFFDVDDIDRIGDDELYQRLLGEFPDWLRVAAAAGVLR